MSTERDKKKQALNRIEVCIKTTQRRQTLCIN